MATAGTVNVKLGIIDEATKKLSSMFGGMAATAAKFGASFGAFKFMQTGITAASDLGETVNALNIILGEESAAALEEFSENVALSVGMAQSEFLALSQSFSGIMGDLVKDGQIGATQIGELTERVGDLGSMFNLTSSELESGLMSALAGRTSQTLQKIGIDLSATALNAEIAAGAFTDMGISSNMTMAQLDADTQILLRYTQFMRDSDQAAGDFSNTLEGSLANQIKLMKANFTDAASEIMSVFLPAINSLISHLATLAVWIGENKTLIFALGAAFAGFKLGGFLVTIATAVKALWALGIAKIVSQTGVGAVFAIPVVLAAAGVGLAVAHGFGAFGGGETESSGTGSSTVDNQVHVEVNVDTSNGSTTTNGATANVNSGFGASGIGS